VLSWNECLPTSNLQLTSQHKFLFLLPKEIENFKGFRAQLWKSAFFYTFALLTGGISLLVSKWSTKVHTLLSLVPCSLREAQYILVKVNW
jgi:hypothetical protein